MKKVILGILSFSPVLAFAQTLSALNQFVTQLGAIVKLATPVVSGLALLVFFWGLVKYIFAQGNEESKADAKKIMLWGIIALFVMISIWGIITLIQTNLGVSNVQSVQTPSIN